MIPAGAAAGDQTQQYDNIPTPATCTVTETVDGHTSTVSVVVEGSGQTVSVPPGDVVEADVSDSYGLVPGQLLVTKTIAGSEAGQQSTVTIHTECDGVALTPDFVIPAGTPAGVVSHIYSPVAAGAVCTVTETVDGHTSTVSVTVEGSPHTTTVPPADGAAATIVDTYGTAPGELTVTKEIAGPEAGHQGPITIHVVCDGTALSPDFVIPAGTPPGTLTHTFHDIPAGSVCTVTETSDGATSTITVTVTGNGQHVTVPSGKDVVVGLIDVYEATPGNVDVIKEITGSGAGQQGEIAILVACGGPVNNFVMRIPAHTPASSVSRFINNIPAGSDCLVSEPNHRPHRRCRSRGPRRWSNRERGRRRNGNRTSDRPLHRSGGPILTCRGLTRPGRDRLRRQRLRPGHLGGDRHGGRRDAARRGIAMAATVRQKPVAHRLAPGRCGRSDQW